MFSEFAFLSFLTYPDPFATRTREIDMRGEIKVKCFNCGKVCWSHQQKIPCDCRNLCNTYWICSEECHRAKGFEPKLHVRWIWNPEPKKKSHGQDIQNLKGRKRKQPKKQKHKIISLDDFL